MSIAHFSIKSSAELLTRLDSVVLGVGWSWRPGRAGCRPDLGADVEQVDAGGLGQGQARSELALRMNYEAWALSWKRGVLACTRGTCRSNGGMGEGQGWRLEVSRRH